LLALPHDQPTASGTVALLFRWLLLAGTLALLGLAVYLLPREWYLPTPKPPDVDHWERTLSKTREHLARGRFRRAVHTLGELSPDPLPDEQRRAWRQWHRQASLAADLADLSLEELVQLAALQRDPQEWAAQWDRHRGRAVLLDGVLRRDATDRLVLLGFTPHWKDEPIRIALDQVQLLRALPLQGDQRVIFGIRLARIEREVHGWAIHPVPESGVLFTDAATLEALSPVDLGADLPEVMQRQAAWLAAVRF
jgi:hypothetical protein